ncbi:DUF262 domain-containing protein [Shewanella sp. HL-SH4]|uniref:DUF262 domain-containing protein n=1 Tax=Shewanella sp. HL-SH4 TaxID=3436240 RepID=UPI003EBF86E3
MKLDNLTTYRQLLKQHGSIQIPIIQRDYAQGRPAEVEVREEFLSALESALCKPADDPSLPLNLDFIYGSVEGYEETRFLPLDGQQRLTTLFLLHWYLAWRDDDLEMFSELFVREGKKSRFSYDVRPSSNEFFDQLVVYHPQESVDKVSSLSDLICDQAWYFISWRLDPTIQSVLSMLDAIHKRFASPMGLFARLIDEASPAITFQSLDLLNFGLSDDLYIKMNARGKPLTAFETFKARYEQLLKSQLPDLYFDINGHLFPMHEYVAIKMDTQWGDLFWQYRNSLSNTFDEAFLRLFRAVALVTLDSKSDNYLVDVEKLRNARNKLSYNDYHNGSWLDEQFSLSLIYLLSLLKYDEGDLCSLSLDTEFFNESSILQSVIKLGRSLSYTEAVQFAAYVGYIRQCKGKVEKDNFNHWMRVIRNLSENTSYNRAYDLRRSIESVSSLLDHADNILGYLANPANSVEGFSKQQIDEERIKSSLILAGSDWWTFIKTAESHGYFKGQIGFLLEFSGINDESDGCLVLQHEELQRKFSYYFTRANMMFDKFGLRKSDKNLWQRALLCIGDYLLPQGRNLSFLVNDSSKEACWKRLLRDQGVKRSYLKSLWDEIEPELNPMEQLTGIIAACSPQPEWLQLIIDTPEVIEFCSNMAIRFESHDEIYILKRSQMNGEYADLYTYCLYHKLLTSKLLSDSVKLHYVTVYDTSTKPRVIMVWECEDDEFVFELNFYKGSFGVITRIYTPQLAQKLKLAGFIEHSGVVGLMVNPSEIERVLKQLDSLFFATE